MLCQWSPAGIATWTMWPLFNIPGADRLLRLLTDGAGWDHCAHSAMVLMTRAKGVVAADDGRVSRRVCLECGAWYSQHPHAAVTSLIELHVERPWATLAPRSSGMGTASR